MPEPWERADVRSGCHVMPVNDWQGHVATEQCWCHPRCEDDVWVHNSLDRREDYEMGRLRFH